MLPSPDISTISLSLHLISHTKHCLVFLTNLSTHILQITCPHGLITERLTGKLAKH
jgi:hypothetical protein